MFSLMYHRIDEPDSNPWGVCVSPEHFEEQIRWITRNYTVVDPATLATQLRHRTVNKKAVLITFDDGYQDNFLVAKPILEKYACPASFFIPTYFIGSTDSFWWDELEAVLLHSPVLPSELELTIMGTRHLFRLSYKPLTDSDRSGIADWRWYETVPADRCAVFLTIWSLLRPLPQSEIERQMRIIRSWGDSRGVWSNIRLPMTGSQLLELSRNSLFRIGVHSHTHPDLSAHDEETQFRELETGHDELKKRFSIDSPIIAYPYGMYNGVTLAVAKRLKFELGFTTSATIIDNDSDPFELGRFQAGNTDLEEFKKSLPE